MTELNAHTFDLADKSPPELEQRRREIIKEIASYPKKWDDPTLPLTVLQELAQVTGMLRRKTAGPPKVAKPSKRGGAPKPTVDDLKGLLA